MPKSGIENLVITLSYSFPGSSMVEWAAVNRLVAGSSPARGAWNLAQIFHNH